MFLQRSIGVLTAVSTVAAIVSCSTEPTLGVEQSKCSSDEIVGWGDSLTASMMNIDGGYRQADPTWLDTLGRDLNLKTYNYGVSGQGSAEVAVRQGGLQPLLTVADEEIPARSESVAITALNPDDGWTRFYETGTQSVHGTLGGVAGSLRHSGSSGVGTFSFVPDVPPPGKVRLPANSLFENNDGDPYRSCFQIIWAGTNNQAQTSAIMRDIDLMVRRLLYPKRYLIIGTIPAVKDQLQMAYGPRFTDLRTWLMSDGLAAIGLAPTPEDTAAIAAGQIAPTLQPDGTHFSQSAYTAIGHHLASVIAALTPG